MISEEKIKQIRKQLSKGEPEGEIKNGLRKDGFTEEQIRELFFNLYEKNTASNRSKHVQSGKEQIFGLIGACLLIAGGAVLAANSWLSEYGTPLIVLGAISFCIKYFIAAKNK